jgi:hypothetical protein
MRAIRQPTPPSRSRSSMKRCLQWFATDVISLVDG